VFIVVIISTADLSYSNAHIIKHQQWNIIHKLEQMQLDKKKCYV